MFKILWSICFIVCVLGPLHAQVPDMNGIIYVKPEPAGDGDGSSWANAMSDLQAAIDADGVSEVWVAAGTYKPTDTDDRTISFEMKNGVTIYGGFPTTGTPGMVDRDWNTYETILSGDIGEEESSDDNSYHVIFNNNNGLDHSAILDGFTVTGGNANGNPPRDEGGGMKNKNSSPAVRNVIIMGNTATWGGGMYNDNSYSPSLTNVTITGNTATSGGGICNYFSSPTLFDVSIVGNTALQGGAISNIESSPILTNVIISGNTATWGGGVRNYLNSSPVLTNVSITGNMAHNYGGGIYNNVSSSPTLTNVTITGNTANHGGGGINNRESSSPTLTNVTITGNTANIGGGIFNDLNSSPNVYNSIIFGNGNSNIVNYESNPLYDHSLVEYLDELGMSNLDGAGYSLTDIFLNPASGDYSLQACSPAINAGANTHFENLDVTTLDLAGQPRVYNFLSAGVIDMGAYEFQGGVDYSMVMFTDTTVEYSGAAHEIEAKGIPQEVNVRYTILNADMDTILQAVDPGVYTVIATFFGCEAEVSRTALLTIELPTARIAPNCAHFSPSVSAEGTAVVSAADFVSNASAGIYPLEVTVYNQWGSRLPGWPQVFNLPSDTYTWDVCSYQGQTLEFSVSNPLGTCHEGQIQLNGSPGAILTSAMQPDAHNPAIDTGLLYVYAGNIPAPEEYIPTVSAPCSGGMATRSGQLTPRVQPDWIMPIPCSEESDTAKVIFRTWEVYDKEGRLSTLTDTLVVFRLPRLTPGAFIGEAEVVYECDLIAEVRSDEPVKRFDSWKQPVGLHDYERPHTGLRGVAYEIPATIILDGLTDAFLQGIHVFLEYLECEILRKAGGDVVTIGDIISGDYMSTLLGGSTPEQKRYGFLQALIELNENPLVFLAQLEYEFYPYLLLEEGDWILSEGGKFEKVTAEWFYNGNGNSPYWFAGGWPRIYGSGGCVSFCDGVDVDAPGCIEIRVPRLSIEAGGLGGDCDTICLPEGVHAGITVEKEELTAWEGSCPQTRGVDTRITQTCWARTPNPCLQEEGYLTCEDFQELVDLPAGDLVVDYACSDKAIKIHLSQWQTIEDNLGPIFDFCYPLHNRFVGLQDDFEEIKEAIVDITGEELLDYFVDLQSEEISSVLEDLAQDPTLAPDEIYIAFILLIGNPELFKELLKEYPEIQSEISKYFGRRDPTIYQVGSSDCAAEVFVPDVQVIDNCSGIHSVKAMVGDRVVALEPNGVEYRMMENGDTCFVYTYSHLTNPIRIPFSGCDGDLTEVRYEAADNCWNQSEWYKYIKVVDYTPPTVVANRHLNVTLQDKYAWVSAESMDEGSWDNCSIDLMLGRRSDWINCVTICENISEPYQSWEAILSDLGLQPGEAGPDFAFLKTLLSDDEVEDYFYDQIVWLWEDEYTCGQKVVHAWLYALAVYLGENCSEADEHGNVLRLQDLEILVDGWFDEPGYAYELALLGGGWAKEVPVKCEDACQAVIGELLVMDDCCNWGMQWTDINVEDNSTARLVRRLPDLEISCEAYNIFYKDIVEAAAALADGGSGTDTTGLFAALDSAFGYYLATWVDNMGRPTSPYGTPLPESLLSFDYRNVSCVEESVIEEVAVYGHDSAVTWETVETTTTILDTTLHTEFYGIIGINCTGAITQDVWVDLDECGQGTIIRRFFISSGCGETVPTLAAEQVIMVGSACGMRPSMFDLPENVGTKDAPICLPQGLSDNYLPQSVASLTLKDHLVGRLCNSFAVGSTIHEYDIQGASDMKKYLIEWSVVDWCASHTSSNREFTYTQEVIAKIDPSCDAITQTVVSEPNSPKGIVNRKVDQRDFILYQNYPNPYEGYTVIGFHLPERTSARLTIYDVTGRLIKRIEGKYNQGYNEVQLSGWDLDAKGVLYYQLDTDRYTATKRMVVVD